MRIAIIGNLCNLGYLTLLALNKYDDIKVDLFISAHELNNISDPRREDINCFQRNQIFFWEDFKKHDNDTNYLITKYCKYRIPQNNKLAILKLAKYANGNYDYIIGVTLGSIIALLSAKKFMWFATGSDLREWVFRKNKFSSIALRFVAKYTTTIISGNDNGTLLAATRLKVDNKLFPLKNFPVNMDKMLDIKRNVTKRNNNSLSIFNPSNQIWNIKGNDKLIKAVGRLIRDGYSIKLHLLYRGEDAEKSKNLVEDLQITKYVQWGQTLSKDELYIAMAQADIIADQFILGDIGGIGREACCLGKPVLAYLNDIADDRPIINCFTVTDIYNAIIKCMDATYRLDISARASKYSLEEYSLDKYGDTLISLIKE